jgi:hypothetical protein
MSASICRLKRSSSLSGSGDAAVDEKKKKVLFLVLGWGSEQSLRLAYGREYAGVFLKHLIGDWSGPGFAIMLADLQP